MTEENLKAGIEALLFIYGEPITIKKIAEALQRDEATVLKTLDLLSNDLKAEGRGLTLLTYDNRVQLGTKPHLSSLLQIVLKSELSEDVTPAALETLSIITYAGPCGRAFIDYVRGVNSSFILRSLLMRGLIERFQDPQRQNAFLYQVTFDFLRHLGVSSVSELPEYMKYQELITAYRNVQSSPISSPNEPVQA